MDKMLIQLLISSNSIMDAILIKFAIQQKGRTGLGTLQPKII